MFDTLEDAHKAIRAEAVRRAGGRDDLVQRALNYLDLFRHSGGNHGFTLLAAHGALWGSGHFRRGQMVGKSLSRLTGKSKVERQRQLQKIAGFSSALKEINRRVFIETYTAYHLTAQFGDDPALANHIPVDLIAMLNRCHAARRAGVVLPAEDRRALFEAFFLWEQTNIVGPAVEAAVAELDWPLLRKLSVKPPIGFAYFPKGKWLWFRAFDRAEERLLRGRQAFALAEACGWAHVEDSLWSYGILPGGPARPRKTGLCRRLRAKCNWQPGMHTI